MKSVCLSLLESPNSRPVVSESCLTATTREELQTALQRFSLPWSAFNSESQSAGRLTECLFALWKVSTITSGELSFCMIVTASNLLNFRQMWCVLTGRCEWLLAFIPLIFRLILRISTPPGSKRIYRQLNPSGLWDWCPMANQWGAKSWWIRAWMSRSVTALSTTLPFLMTSLNFGEEKRNHHWFWSSAMFYLDSALFRFVYG